jgi:hypothetical protein
MGLSSQVDVGSTPTAQMYGSNINPTVGGTFNDRATISFNSCTTFSVNWINYNTQPAGTVDANDWILGVEIDDAIGSLTIQNLIPVTLISPIIGASQVSARLPIWAPNSVCGRFGNSNKFASFITNEPMYSSVFAKVTFQNFDCSTSLWRGTNNNVKTPIKIVANEKQIELYPNPSSDVLHLNLKNDKLVSSIEIWNVFGQKLISKTVTNHEEIIDFSLREFPQGAYYIKVIKSDNSSEVLNFIHH